MTTALRAANAGASERAVISTGLFQGTMDLSRFCSAPLIAIVATKEMNYGTNTDG